MKTRLLLLALVLTLASGCGEPIVPAGPSAPAPAAAASAPEPTLTPAPENTPGEAASAPELSGRTGEFLLPAEDTDPQSWTPEDFPGCFDGEGEPQKEEYPLLPGTEWENTALCLQGQKEGPTLYIVAGLHGDETAGWLAGNLLKQTKLAAGRLYIVSPANLYGAQNDVRTTASGRDLNRNFPGDADGADAARIAGAIFEDIRQKQPDLVLDLHEARAQQQGRDALGNTLICQSVEDIGELVWDLLLETEEGRLCSGAFSLYGSPPAGSLNRTVTLELDTPCITVETYREEPLAGRVRNQLELAGYILSRYGMV